MKILFEDCDSEKAEDRTLPYSAYIITYKVDEQIKYDIASAPKRVDIFDYYWDKYREGFMDMKQTEGRTNPRVWGNKPPSESKKRK